MKQPPGFENPKFPNRVYKLQKALYGLKQAPRAWYDRLKTFLLVQGFKMGCVDKTLFLMRFGTDFLLVQIYVDDIIFGGSSHALVSKFSEQMSREFEMSMMGELQFFLGLQIKQTPQGTFVHQAKYTRDLLRKFDMSDLSPQPTPISTSTALDEDLDGGPEGVQKHDRLPPVPDGDPSGHSVRGLPLRAVPGFSAHLPQAGGETHLQVSEIHP